MMVTEDLVEEAGFDSVVAANADQAIAILERRNDIRIVLTDVNMPGSMDGLRLAAVVRDRWPPAELVVVSGAVLAEHVQLPERSLLSASPTRPIRWSAPCESLPCSLRKPCALWASQSISTPVARTTTSSCRKILQAFFDSSPTTAG